MGYGNENIESKTMSISITILVLEAGPKRIKVARNSNHRQ